MKVNPLVVYLQPKDIDEVLIEFEKITKYDRLNVKYIAYPYPHLIAQDFFLMNKQYTHIFLWVNDIIVKSENIEMLIDDFEKHQDDVICGCCNVDTAKYKDKIVITATLPDLDYDKRHYYWISKNRYPNMYFEVPHAGMPLMGISRDVMAKFPLVNMSKYPGAASADIRLSHDCNRLGIKIHTNTANMMNHLRYFGEMQVGKKKPEVIFLPKNSNEKIKIDFLSGLPKKNL